MLDAAKPQTAVTPPAEADSRVTPLMEQYIEIKTANPDSLLFYRMGDFYELFFDDAVQSSRALGIALTKRGKHLGEDIPMAGVPVHAADDYLQRLIQLGFKVAVCEQVEDPAEAKKRGAKSVVKRDVVRLVTPGTLTEDSLLEARRSNFLLAVARAKVSSTGGDAYGLAWVDISTGEFRVAETDGARLAADHQHVADRDRGAGLGFELLDDDNVVLGDFVLLAAGANYCIHIFSFPLPRPPQTATELERAAPRPER